ncbi:MAG TPA: 2-amino-4-hydroxy-6-hydroxymethyldihydropteridine diphosphokinase [Candidatus Barnesiella excrementipullorum]|uniref:2-amino-4-hydroxy-6-hydroxymethyldihydropteridine pyrophosphokinase n=1 Tax=Candidatus Barnesiella excrementipullorum TaxID=2838479 RepID=A0A9D1VQA4_9BACT|nr:2-amino-4-hydroxy-6-hydroxymethyldihydropteridine diphosphokinase [Candidatus Barnesiella excrementipullorum]
MNHALISLAANDEKKETTIAHALRLIESYCVILNQTPVYRSEAAGESQQPSYANALLQVETDQEYEELRRRFKSLEHDAGRTPASKERGIIPLDIDIISWNETLLKNKDMEYDYMKKGLHLLAENNNS